MRNLFLTVALVIASAVGISAQTAKADTFNDDADIYVGYQYTNSDVDKLRGANTPSGAQTFLTSDGASHGFNIGVTYYGSKTGKVGVIMETAGTFGDRNVATALTGVQLKKRTGTFQPFARGLAGFGGSINSNGPKDRLVGFAYGGGVGLDIKANDKVAFRVASVDLVRISSTNKGSENYVRFGAGLVF